jgi:hypothetical protein
MGTRSIFQEVRPAEYEKIRKFVLGQLAKAGDAPMRLASSRELAKLFDVSQSTVVKALKDLVSDGYLTMKPGIGLFTNPAKSKWRSDAKLIAFLNLSGNSAFITRFGTGLASAFTEELMSRSSKYVLQSCFLAASPEKSDVELAGKGYDAVVWLFPGKAALPSLARLRASGMPVVAADGSRDPISSTYFDYEGVSWESTTLMLSEGRGRVGLALDGGAPFKNALIAGMKRAFAEKWLPFNPKSVYVASYGDELDFRSYLASFNPDALIFSTGPERYWRAVNEMLDIDSGCRLFATDAFVQADMNYTGHLLKPDFSSVGAHLADCLEAQLEGRPMPEPKRIETKIVFQERS